MPEFLNNETLSLVFDAVLILSVVGLWFLWWQQAQQRKGIESMLMEASAELQEATLLLNQALQQIQDLQASGHANVEPPKPEKSAETVAKEAFREKMQRQVASNEDSQPTANISQVAQMLRLQREGLSPEKISEKLQMPLAQIKLMLMLQSSPKLDL